MSKVIRSVKNVTKGYSSVQVKVREGALGADFPSSNWAPDHPLSAWLIITCSDQQRPMGTYGDSDERDRAAHI